MNEKIYEFQLDHGLTVLKRRLISDYIETHAHRSPWKIAYEWDLEARTLHVKTNVVTWALIFHSKDLTIYGTGPFWAKMLFTEKLREKLRLGLLHVLQEVGLLDVPKKAKPTRKKSSK